MPNGITEMRSMGLIALTGVNGHEFFTEMNAPFVRKLKGLYWQPDGEGTGDLFSMHLSDRDVPAGGLVNSFAAAANEESVWFSQLRTNQMQWTPYIPLHDMVWEGPLWIWTQDGGAGNPRVKATVLFETVRLSEREYAELVGHTPPLGSWKSTTEGV
jgi:hypothetical protein